MCTPPDKSVAGHAAPWIRPSIPFLALLTEEPPGGMVVIDHLCGKSEAVESLVPGRRMVSFRHRRMGASYCTGPATSWFPESY